MSELLDCCKFLKRPISKEANLSVLKEQLKSGIPATVTTEEVEKISKLEASIQKSLDNHNENNEVVNTTETVDIELDHEDGNDSTGTTPLHLIVLNYPLDASDNEKKIIIEMIDILFQYGASWNILDKNDKTPGCIALDRKLTIEIYSCFVEAGTRAEVLIRRMNIDDDQEEEISTVIEQDPTDQETYLKTELEYKDHSLVTKERNDGVMMDWEQDIMKQATDIIFSSSELKPDGPIVLNIGFGMGIIDNFIQLKNPVKHYICEAHPDVLKKLKDDGWYNKENVIILEGRWQETLGKLLSKGIYFDGIYYDTFSENYSKDMIDLFDFVVGLLKPEGVFSFFNGLGADRQICYDVYRRVVQIDLADYGLDVKYKEVSIDLNDSVWEGIHRSYWRCSVYYHPIIKFQSI